MSSDTTRIRTATRRPSGYRVASYVVMAAFALAFAFPLVWMVSTALKPLNAVFSSTFDLFPAQPQWSNYLDVFTVQPFAGAYWNSVYIAVLVTVGSMAVAGAAGYAFARIRFPGQNLMFLLLLCGLLVPSEVTIVPLFRGFSEIGLVDSHLPLIIIPVFGAHSILGTFIMRQFFLGLPLELEEAGRLDGLSRFGLFWRIALPLARPPLAALTVLSFLHSWNLFLEPLVFVSSREIFTLPIVLNQYNDAYGEPLWNVQMAATTLTILPVVAVFIAAQKTFIRGLTATGLKG